MRLLKSPIATSALSLPLQPISSNITKTPTSPASIPLDVRIVVNFSARFECRRWNPLFPTRYLVHIPAFRRLFPEDISSIHSLHESPPHRAIEISSSIFNSIGTFFLTHCNTIRDQSAVGLRSTPGRILAPFLRSVTRDVRTSTSQWVLYREYGSGCLLHQSFPRSTRASRNPRTPPGWPSSGGHSG